jgi:hypothetical protein
MAPVGLLYERGTFIVVHECTGCRFQRCNRAGPSDDLSPLLG